MQIIEILEQYSIPFMEYGEHHHVTEGWVQVDCPWCSKDSKRWRLGLSLEGRACSCWTCGAHSVLDTLVELTGEKYGVIKKLLDSLIVRKDKKELRLGKLILPSNLGPLLPIHKKYLENRGFDVDNLIKLWNIQGIGLSTNLAWRIFIPIIHKGEMVSWTTRAIVDDVDRRYINADKKNEKINLKKVLYGSDFARHTIIIVEGPTDVWNIGPGAVATLGVGYTRAQLVKMSKYPIRVVCYDSDDAGQQRAKELCNNLKVHPGKTLNIVLDAPDPGAATKQEIKLLRSKFLD